MEFARRGPATDDHRCPDPPPHGEAMLVARDALLWQLQKDRLRQEIIMTELAKIEGAMALRAVSDHHSTPMTRDSMPPHRGPVFGWEHFADVGEENDVKLPNNYGRQGAESRFWNPTMEDRAEKCLNPCKCRVNSGEHNSAFDEQKMLDSSENVPPNKASPAEKWELTGITIPVKKPKPPMSPRKRKKPPMRWSCPVCQVQANSAQKHCAGKKHRSNIATLESSIKAIGRHKPPLAGCSICQVMCGTESDLEIHLKGKRHLKKIQDIFEESNNKAITSESLKANLNPDSGQLHVEKMSCDLDSENHLRDERHQLNVRTLCETVNQKENSPPEISKDQTPSSEWDCALCQAKCISKAHFENHCISRKHQQRTQVILSQCDITKTGRTHAVLSEGDVTKMGNLHMEASCKEGSNNDMANNVVSQEAKSHESNVPEHAEKPPSVQSCNICQGICNCAPDFDMPQHVEETSCKLNWESYPRLRDESLQLMDDRAVCEKTNQDKSDPQEISKDQTPSSEWDCATCQAKCNSEPQIEHHCKSGKHQQKIDATLHEGDIAEVSSLIAAPCKEGNNSDTDIAPREAKSDESNVSQHAAKPPSVWCCSDCQVICGRKSDFEVHLKRERHLKKIGALLKESKNMAISESQKANLYPDSTPQHAEKMNCVLDLENNLRDEGHQLNVHPPCKENNQMKNNPPHIMNDQEPPLEWDCAMCQEKCNAESQIEHHCESRRHQQKTDLIFREADVTVNSLHIPASCKERDNNSTGITPQEAKSDENNVQQHAEKPPPAWDCSDCQVTCDRESDFVFHLNGKRHLKKFRALLDESQNKAINSESQTANLNQDSVLQHVEKTNCELNWESYLRRDEKHQLNVQALGEAINQDKDSPAKKDQIPSSGWDCAMCQAKCNSKAQLEHHCTSIKHQQKMKVVLGEGDIAKASSRHLEVPCKEGSNNDMAKNMVSQEAKSTERNAPPHREKPPLAVPQSKTSLAEKLELTGITIPVKNLKPPMKWNCTVCQVQATSERNLQMHYAGQKHLAIVATLGLGTKASDQKVKAAAAAESSLGTEQKKTSSINWSCSTCQARGTSKSTFDAHLQGKRHQQNITEASVKGDGNGAPKNAAADGITLPKLSEKPSEVWGCTICQTACTCETDLKNHLSGTRHREKVQSLLEESKNMKRDPETNLKKNNAPQMVKKQEPRWAWNCTMCEAKCYSKSQFEDHCGGSRHQQKIQAILGKRETAKASSSRTANEPASDGSSGKNAGSEEAEKKATLHFCEVCNLLCSSSETLVSHRYGKRHREKLSARK